jgi:hypothetical protein
MFKLEAIENKNLQQEEAFKEPICGNRKVDLSDKLIPFPIYCRYAFVAKRLSSLEEW